MGFNLTNEQIQNTYQQLVQVSGSTLVNGTGSAISFSAPTASYASFALTASYALNGTSGATTDTGSLMVTGSVSNNVLTFTKGNGSQFSLTVVTGSVDVSGKLDTSVFNAYTSSNDAAVGAKLATSTFTSYSSSVSTRLTNDETSINALNAATSSYVTSLPSGLVSSSAQISYNGITNVPAGILSSSTQVVSTLSGQTLNLQNLQVQGTASFGYIESVTGSAKIIGDAFIILNNDTPTQQLAGISVVDSGSTSTTSSFLWDGASNDWKYQYHLGGTHETAVALFASGSTIGTTVYPTANKLQKGGGSHHLYDSNITDNGSIITMGVRTDITGALDVLGTVSIEGAISSSGGVLISMADGQDFIVQQTGYAASGSRVIIGARTGSVQQVGVGSILIGGGTNAGTSALKNAGSYSVVIGGASNFITASNFSTAAESVAPSYATIIGGQSNNILNSGSSATAAGSSAIISGFQNTIQNRGANGAFYSAIIAGFSNTIQTPYSFVGGGARVTFTTGSSATVSDNQFNISMGAGGTTTANASRIEGGYSSLIGARASGISGYFSTIISTDLARVTGSFSGILAGVSGSVTHDRSVAIGGTRLKSTAADQVVVPNLLVSGSTGITFLNGTTQTTAWTGTATTASFAATASSADSFNVRNGLSLTGSVSSVVTELSIASSTASVDLSTSNFFQKALTAATYVANPTNAKPGSTYTFQFDSGSLISDWGSDYLFAGGTNPTLSVGQDIVTFVSFVSGSSIKLYGTGLANFS